MQISPNEHVLHTFSLVTHSFFHRSSPLQIISLHVSLQGWISSARKENLKVKSSFFIQSWHLALLHSLWYLLRCEKLHGLFHRHSYRCWARHQPTTSSPKSRLGWSRMWHEFHGQLVLNVLILNLSWKIHITDNRSAVELMSQPVSFALSPPRSTVGGYEIFQHCLCGQAKKKPAHSIWVPVSMQSSRASIRFYLFILPCTLLWRRQFSALCALKKKPQLISSGTVIASWSLETAFSLHPAGLRIVFLFECNAESMLALSFSRWRHNGQDCVLAPVASFVMAS